MLQKCSYLAMTFCYSPEHRVLARVLPWLAIGDFHHITHHVKYKCFMPDACVDSSLQLSISAETIHTASHFKPSEYQT
jgi:hypothetical protein